ncbi:hypothetical protein [Nioella sp. MMSF_3534]|uniref:hypothetical protein n=1 Tax=Nioella sp. MMSF_3534 TaxID=3046720 RepID=UPI00273D6089|nr:hypothetical protein [Nioella sp. MMSF_3534]
MIQYQISPGEIKTFASPFQPFLTFNEFVNIVQWYRDSSFAPDNVPGFEKDVGQAYNVWTRRAVSTYHRHIFPDELSEDVTIAFEIPHLERNASFPIRVTIFDTLGVYFEHEQEVVVERLVDGRFLLTGWRKVPQVAKFLLSQQG